MLDAGHLLLQLRRGARRAHPRCPTRTETTQETAENAEVLRLTDIRLRPHRRLLRQRRRDLQQPGRTRARSTSTTRRCRRARRPSSHSRFDCFNTRFQIAARDELGARPSTTSSCRSTTPRASSPGKRTPERRHRQQRLGAGAVRRGDLALLDLGQLADPGHGGRLPGRRRPRRRPPDARARDQPLHAAREPSSTPATTSSRSCEPPRSSWG